MIGKFKAIGGEEKEIMFDNKIKKINLELGTDKIGTPLIQIQNWTGKKCKTLVTLHIKEAIELKTVIDNLVFDWFDGLFEEQKEKKK